MSKSLYKGQIFAIKGQRMILTTDISELAKTKGLVVLNYWEQCAHEDISVLPGVVVPYRSVEEKYEVTRTNIVLGEVDEICLD